MRRLALALLLAALVTPGCSSGPSHPAPAGDPVPQVGSVVVTMSGELPKERQEQFEKLGGPFLMKGAFEAALARGGKLDAASPVALAVEVSKFRLRTGATVFWAGAMAGGDVLDVRAVARDGDRDLRRVETGAGSIGGLAGLTQTSRFARLVEAVADRVVKDL